jgi:hypothetical protein
MFRIPVVLIQAGLGTMALQTTVLLCAFEL